MENYIAAQVAELTPEQKENILHIHKKYSIIQLLGMIPAYILGFICFFYLPEFIDSLTALLCGATFFLIGIIWILGVVAYVKKKYPYYSDKKVKYIKNSQTQGTSKNRGFGKSILLFVVMFLAILGQNAQAELDSGTDFDSAYYLAFLYAVTTLCILSLIMMAVPCICMSINGMRLPQKKGKKICLWNSIILFVVSGLLFILEVPFPIVIGGLGALCFYFINRWLFVSDYPEDVAQ